MIYTITLNPAIDYFMNVEKEILVDEVNRSSEELFKPAGKGINISLDLNNLSTESTAIVLVGGFTGNQIVEMIHTAPKVQLIPIPVDGTTRVNVKVRHGYQNFCFNGNGPIANRKTMEKLLEVLDNLKKEDWVILSGSVMKGIDTDSILQIAERIHYHESSFVVDMEDLSTELLSLLKPDLIKPNLYELGLMFSRDDVTTDNAIPLLEKIHQTGTKNILLSAGKDGAILSDEFGKLWKLIQSDAPGINKVGTGDAMIALYVEKIIEGNSPEEALRWAGAAGNAVSSTFDPLSKELLEQFYEVVHVKEIEYE